MPRGSVDDMLNAFQNRIDELSFGVVDSAEEIMSACKDGVCDKDEEPTSGNQPIMASGINEYIDKFIWEINDEIIGSDIDVEDVTCTAKNNKFILTVQLESGEEVDFEIPFSDLTCSVDTLSDDLDYVVSEVEAELL